jgi:hypothetical protein
MHYIGDVYNTNAIVYWLEQWLYLSIEMNYKNYFSAMWLGMLAFS